MQWLGRRAVFLLNVPVVAVALPAAARLVRETSEPPGRRLDRPGMLLGAVALLAVTYAFIEAGCAGAGGGVGAAIGVAVAATAGSQSPSTGGSSRCCRVRLRRALRAGRGRDARGGAGRARAAG